MSIPIDHTVYPDESDPPTELDTLEAKADYVHRICAAWDFHIHPDPETFELFATWKDVFDQFPIPTSPAYEAFRMCFGWEPVAMPPGVLGPVPLYEHLDRLEDRPPDPCRDMI